MSAIEQNLFTYLSTYAGLTALISTRIYPNHILQGATLPNVTYFRVSTPRVASHDSSSIGSELSHPRIQFSSWATTYASCKAINDQLRKALQGNPTVTGIQSSLSADEVIRYEPDTELFHGVNDFIVWAVE